MITDYFNSLTQVMQLDYAAARKTPHHGDTLKIVTERFLKPFLPSSTRQGYGFVLDVFERQAGPFDVVAASDFWPPVGQGDANRYLVDGVIFCLSARDWATADLTQFAATARDLKALKRKATHPLLCTAFSFTPLETPEVLEFLKSNAGIAVDAVFSLGRGLVIRNNFGWYGDPQRLPFVTENVAAPALKFYALYLLQAVHAAAGVPFGWADYQHL